MNNFDKRWQASIQAARKAPTEPIDLPYGFTTRLLARFHEAPVEAWSEVFAILGLRALFVTALLFFVSASFAAAHWYEFRIETPALENPLSVNPLTEPFSSWL